MISILLTTLLSFQAQGLVSKFPSTVDGLDTPNSHVVYKTINDEGIAYRGNAPRNKKEIKQLQDLGVKTVIMFKSQTRSEIDDEITWIDELNENSKKSDKISYHHIPFPWKDFEDFQIPCRQTVKALKIIEKHLKKEKKVFFHCTVGEDRTGYLAGLMRVYFQGWSLGAAFNKEMCANGYAAGNPNKPMGPVVMKIRESITPMYAKMTYLLRRLKKNKQRLTYKICDEDPGISDENYINHDFYPRLEKYTCEPSKKI